MCLNIKISIVSKTQFLFYVYLWIVFKSKHMFQHKQFIIKYFCKLKRKPKVLISFEVWIYH